MMSKITFNRVYDRYKSVAPVLTIIIAIFTAYLAWEQNKLNQAHHIEETRRLFISNSIDAITEINSSISTLARSGKELARKASLAKESLSSSATQSSEKLLLNQDIRESLGNYYGYWEDVKYKIATNQHRIPNHVIDLYQKFQYSVAFEKAADVDIWNKNIELDLWIDDSTMIKVNTNDRDVLLYGEPFIEGQFIHDDKNYSREFYSVEHLLEFLESCFDMGMYTDIIQYDLIMEISNYMILAAYGIEEFEIK